MQSFEPVQSFKPMQAMETIEFEDAQPENDDQETTVVRHVAMLMDRGERSGGAPPSTRPMLRKATQPSIAR